MNVGYEKVCRLLLNQVGKIIWSKSMKALISKKNLVNNAIFHRKPMEIAKNRSNMIMSACTSTKLSRRILNTLKLSNKCVRKTI